MKNKLEQLVVNISDRQNLNPITDSMQLMRLAREILDTTKFTSNKCESISQIDGNPAIIKKVYISGKSSVEYFEITYMSNGQELTKKYSKQEFYDL